MTTEPSPGREGNHQPMPNKFGRTERAVLIAITGLIIAVLYQIAKEWTW